MNLISYPNKEDLKKITGEIDTGITKINQAYFVIEKNMSAILSMRTYEAYNDLLLGIFKNLREFCFFWADPVKDALIKSLSSMRSFCTSVISVYTELNEVLEDKEKKEILEELSHFFDEISPTMPYSLSSLKESKQLIEYFVVRFEKIKQELERNIPVLNDKINESNEKLKQISISIITIIKKINRVEKKYIESNFEKKYAGQLALSLDNELWVNLQGLIDSFYFTQNEIRDYEAISETFTTLLKDNFQQEPYLTLNLLVKKWLEQWVSFLNTFYEMEKNLKLLNLEEVNDENFLINHLNFLKYFVNELYFLEKQLNRHELNFTLQNEETLALSSDLTNN